MIKKSCNTKCDMGKESKPSEKCVKFTLEIPNANKVTLAGDFNNWDASGLALKKIKSKVWGADVKLKPGRYEYKFVVDGNWIIDPNNNNRSINGLGTENSVIIL